MSGYMDQLLFCLPVLLAFHILIFSWSSQFSKFDLMVGTLGRAVGVEHISELVSFLIENIQKSAAATQLKDGSLSVHVGGMVFQVSV